MLAAEAIKVVIADDHRLVRAGLRALLDPLEDIEVVAEVSDGSELLGLLSKVQADLVLIDLGMPGTDGITALRSIRKRDLSLKVIVVSMDDSPLSIRRAVDSGANGYVRKGSPASELATAIRSAMASGSYFTSGVMQRLLQPLPAALLELLTERQVKILQLLADGKATKEIAFELALSTKTVDTHRRRVMEQLRVNDIASLTRFAVRHGLVTP